MKYLLALLIILTPTLVRAELLDYSSGKFIESTAQVDTSQLQDRLNRAKATVGQVTERCEAEVSQAYALLDAVQKDVDISKAVEAGATLAEAKTGWVFGAPLTTEEGITIDEGIYP